MAYERRSFAGGAASTTITGAITASDTSIAIAASTGWPSGSAGDFFVVIDRGLATEEKVRISSRTSLSLTVSGGASGRGVDGTSATAHSASATIEVCLTATDLDEANAHIADDNLDHHSQYLNTTRHDVEARHTFGAALGTPATPASIGTANATGTGDNPAREDHVHELGTGSIDTAAQFAAGVVNAAAIGADAVTTAKILDANVTTAKVADSAITTAKIADANVTTAKLADDSVTNAKLAVAYDSGEHTDAITSGTQGDDGIAVAFAVTFAAAPVVVATIRNTSSADILLNIETISTTGFTYRAVHRDASTNFSAGHTYYVDWVAIGALA